jgi:hypothetical protein
LLFAYVALVVVPVLLKPPRSTTLDRTEHLPRKLSAVSV